MSTQPPSIQLVSIAVTLAASCRATWSITSGNAEMVVNPTGSRSAGFSIKPQSSSTPLSLTQVSLSDQNLSITAGASGPLVATIVINMALFGDGTTVSGVADSSDSGLIANATYSNGTETDMSQDWNLTFGN